MATSPTRRLQDKVAIITGSSSGIGEGIAFEFARQGASITLNGRNVELLDVVEKKCIELAGDKNKVLTIVGDVTQDDLRIKLIEETVNKFGKLDTLVNNAGTFVGSPLSDNFDLSNLDEMLNIHLRAPFHLTKLAIPHLVKTKGSIINISSVGGMKCFGAQGVEYGTAKAAQDHFSRFAALELGAKGVRVNTISPGVIRTPIFEKTVVKPEQISMMIEQMAKVHALQRIGMPDEVAKVASFLASDEASFVTGITMPVDGGALLVPPSAFQQSSNK